MSNTTSETTATLVCPTCHRNHPADEMVKVARGRYDRYDGHTHDHICARCARSYATTCTHCNETVYVNQTRSLIGGSGRICETCRYSSAFRVCSGCNLAGPRDDFVEQVGYYYCPTCLHQHANFDFGDFHADDRTDKIRSDRCFGVELETESCDGYYDALADHPAWGAKEDCTVSGKEFFSAILKGDAGLEAVDEIAEVADENDWFVRSNCGFHLHLDMRGEKRDSLYAIAYAYRATEKVWLSFASRSRRNGSYCHTCEWTCADIDRAVSARSGVGTRFGNWADHQGRYNWVNVQAYGCHKTIEIRLHDGTCDGEAVTNWIKANTRFADWASKLGYEGVKKALTGLSTDEMFAFMCQEVWADGDLTIYYGTKGKTNDCSYLTTSVGRDTTPAVSF
jgi:hypothetical protein